MRLYEIYNEVTALCPDIDCELDESFGAALSRALSLISSERRLEGRCVIPAYGQKPLTRVENFRHHGGKTETLPLVGRAYSLIVCGKGSFTVSSGAEERRYAFDTNGRLYRGFIPGNATLVFDGAHSFDAYSLSTYSEVFSDDESDIPDGSGISRYSLRERCADFGGFLGAGAHKDLHTELCRCVHNGLHGALSPVGIAVGHKCGGVERLTVVGHSHKDKVLHTHLVHILNLGPPQRRIGHIHTLWVGVAVTHVLVGKVDESARYGFNVATTNHCGTSKQAES